MESETYPKPGLNEPSLVEEVVVRPIETTAILSPTPNADQVAESVNGVIPNKSTLLENQSTLLENPDHTSDTTLNDEIAHRLKSRIPKGWGCWISCDTGWYALLDDLDQKISYLAPEYELHQVKEKYGTLRYYIGGPVKDRITAEIIADLVSQAEDLSARICENCGSGTSRIRSKYDWTVKTRDNGWIKTLCDTCALSQGYSLDSEEEGK